MIYKDKISTLALKKPEFQTRQQKPRTGFHKERSNPIEEAPKN